MSTDHRHRVFVIGVCVLFLFSMGCASQKPDSEQFVNARNVTGESLDSKFDRALVEYIHGDLRHARELLETHKHNNPSDKRSVILLRSIYREQGTDTDIESTSPQVRGTVTGPQAITLILHRNKALQQKIYSLIDARGKLNEVNAEAGPVLQMTTRFVPSGVFVSLTKSLLSAYGGSNYSNRLQAQAELTGALSEYVQTRQRVLYEGIMAFHRAQNYAQRQRVLQMSLLLDTLHRTRVENFVKYAETDRTELPSELARINKINEQYQAAQNKRTESLNRFRSLAGRKLSSNLKPAAQQIVRRMPGGLPEIVRSNSDSSPLLLELEARRQEIRAEHAGDVLRELRGDLFTSYGSSSDDADGSNFLTDFGMGSRFRIPLRYQELLQARTQQERALLNQVELEFKRQRQKLKRTVRNLFQSYETRHNAVRNINRVISEYDTVVINKLRQQKYGIGSKKLQNMQLYRRYMDSLPEAMDASLKRNREYLRLLRAGGINLSTVEWQSNPWIGESLRKLEDFYRSGVKRGMVLSGDTSTRSEIDYWFDTLEARGIQTAIIPIDVETWSSEKWVKRMLGEARNRGLNAVAYEVFSDTSDERFTNLSHWLRGATAHQNRYGLEFDTYIIAPDIDINRSGVKQFTGRLSETLQREWTGGDIMLQLPGGTMKPDTLETLISNLPNAIDGIVTEKKGGLGTSDKPYLRQVSMLSEKNGYSVYYAVGISTMDLPKDSEVPFPVKLRSFLESRFGESRIPEPDGVYLWSFEDFESRTLRINNEI